MGYILIFLANKGGIPPCGAFLAETLSKLQPLEAVDHGGETQIQVVENVNTST